MDDRDPRSPGGAADSPILTVRGLSVTAGARCLLRNVHFEAYARRVLGIVGPSGAGKTTLLRCLNRLTDLDASLRVSGEVLLHGRSTFAPTIDVDALRAKVGMLFQQPVVFPVSVLRNVLFGARHLHRLDRHASTALAESSLREAALWEEVKDRLHEPAAKLSTGQQQRLCLARTLAVNPEVILMDEPTSALDMNAAQAIEDLILRLRETRTVILVTHNLGQAQRVTDHLARVEVRDGAGEIVESGTTAEVLANLPATSRNFASSPHPTPHGSWSR